MCLKSLLSAVFPIVCAAVSAQEEFVPAGDSAIEYMGRVAAVGEAAQLGFPGVTIRFAYSGPAPKVVMNALSDTCYFDVSVNGSEPVVMRLSKGENEVALPFADGDSEGNFVEIVRRTESWMGEVVFSGLILGEETILAPPPEMPERKLMFIGDSTTCGEYNERFPPNEELSPRTTNARRSYGMLLRERLDAQAHLVAYGGQGIIRDWEGKAEGEDVRLAPDYFELASPAVEDFFWDHSAYQPDVVVISIGTDLDAGVIDVTTLLDAFEAFVMRVRTVHPLAHIVLTEANFHSDAVGSEGAEKREQIRLTLQAVVERGKAQGDLRLTFAPSGYYPGTPDDPHLTVEQHRLLADALEGHIREVAGW